MTHCLLKKTIAVDIDPTGSRTARFADLATMNIGYSSQTGTLRAFH
jgi:hypothetical protein